MPRFAVRVLTGVACFSIALLFAQDAVSPNVVPQGSIALIQLTDRLDTQSAKAGDHFHARLAEPLTTASGLTIAAGAKIKGHISAVEPGLHRRLLLSFDEIETSAGAMPLIATVTGVPGEHGLSPVSDEGEIGRKGLPKSKLPKPS